MLSDWIIWFIRFLASWAGSLMIIWALVWFGLKVIEGTMRGVKGYKYFLEYIYHRKEFREWLKSNCEYHQ
jgi:hypothetical protein